MNVLKKRIRQIEVAEIIDVTIKEYYAEKGLPVPNWKSHRVEWWREYLIGLGIDPNNP